jgi:hypothetical protein
MEDQPTPLTPEVVSAILRDPDSPLYPSKIGVFCDECDAEDDASPPTTDRAEARQDGAAS